jgi:hypothetical protein
VSVSRRVKAVVAASLAVVVAAGIWAWFLSQQGLGDASEWSGVLQGFAAFLCIPALVIGVLALKAPGTGEESGHEGEGSRSQRISIGPVKAGGTVDIDA